MGRNAGLILEERKRLRGGTPVKLKPWLTHGDWVGPGWSDGKAQDSVLGYATARDAFDQTAKEHDAAYASGGDLYKADIEFARQNLGQGFKRTVAGAAVGLQGLVRGVHRKFVGDPLEPAKKSLLGIKKQGLEGIGAHAPHRRFNPGSIVPPNSPVDENWAMTPPDSPDSPFTESSVSNLQGMAKRAATDGDEVPVMPVPRHISKVVPNHFTINCPHEYSAYLNPTTYPNTNSVEVLRIRLNSVYDPVVGAKSNTQPQGRDLWAGHFNYYRVLASHVNIMILNSAPADPNRNPVFNSFLAGFELVDQNMTVCGNLASFLVTKHAKRKYLKHAWTSHIWNGTAVGGYTAMPTDVNLSYSYSPNDWNYHVRQEGSEERWTPILQNPSIDHDLVVRLFHVEPTADALNDNSAMYIMVQINYTVQFMEEKEEAYKVRDTSPATYGGAGEDMADD